MAMNITIEQVDIELAISNYVRTLIPGMAADTRIEVSLSATRGPAGFTAGIRLLSPGEQGSAPVTGPDQTPAAEERQAEKVEEAEQEEEAPAAPVRRTRGPNKPKPAPETVTEEVVEDESELTQEQELAAEAAATEPADDISTQKAPADKEEAIPSRPSLFGNLKKPVN